MGLKEFLVDAKKGLAELQTHPRLHIVIGNESCDLDSTVSAVTYAYFLYETGSKPDTLILPVLNIPRKLFRLRLEILYLLHKHSITQEDLIFVDDLDLQALTQAEDVALSVTLIDHHVPSKSQECLRDFVVKVLDHRPLAGVLPESWNAEIERVGSCCTLVARKMLASEAFSLDSVLAELLLGTILMDTGNMSAMDKVGTPADLEIISQLKAYVSPGTADVIYEGIRNAKADLSSLTVLEMLYKDLKVLHGTHITVAMSSLTAKLEDVMSRPEFADDCAAFCSACPADVLVIMTLWKDAGGSSHRRIAVFSRNRIYREQITDVLLSSVSPNLELEPMTSFSHMDNISAFFQNNVQVFRKGVVPLIQEFLAGEESTPDENLNAVDNLAQQYLDSPLGSDLLSELADASDEDVRKHINLAKAFQSDQFRTSQDRYDLAAIGTDPVISASLSSDSEFSISDKKKEDDDDYENDTDYNEIENKVDEDTSYEFISGAKTSKDFIVNDKSGAGDGADIDALVDIKAVVLEGEGQYVNDLIDFEFDGKGNEDIAVEVSPSAEVNSERGFVSNTLDAAFNVEPQEVDQSSFSDFDVKVSDSRDDTMGDLFSISSDNVDVDSTTVDAKDENNFGDAFQEHSPFNIFGPDNVDGPVDVSSLPTSNQTSGQGSKVPSYPETPPNSCMEPSNAVFNKETQLPSFNSSEMVKRIHEKKAALAGFGGKQKMGMLDDEGPLEGLLLGGENSSGGGGSLISPAVPQNSYVDISKGFDFESSDSQLPKLMDSDILERVNEKRSQFEWSLESLDGSTSGVDIGPVSEEGEKSPFITDATQNITISGGIEPQVPYTPQNSYVEDNFDSYARNNLPSLNNAEMVAKIKAKQSAMFGSHGSSRVSRSSHGSDDSGGCHSPDVVEKSPRGTSLDSPQAPYTPQNSYRDLGILETRNHLPDLNEVAERLSTENPLKRQFGKRSGSNSGGGSRDEENVNLNIHQHNLRHHGRNSSSQSDSQNTMSDVESLMSVSTDIGTPSDNIVASGLASQMRGEMSVLSRKDTDDSDVFSPRRPDEDARDVATPRVSSIDLTYDGVASNNNAARTLPNGIDTDAADGIVRSDSGGVKELFSPYDSEKVQSIEDHALFQVAESIVAQSVAAAVEFSQKETQEGQGRKESRLRWNDDVEVGSRVKENDARRSPQMFVDDYEEDEDDNDGSDIEDDTVGDISESFPDIDLDKAGNENGSIENLNEENAAEDVAAGSFEDRCFDSDFQSRSAQEQSYNQVDQAEEEDNRSEQNAGEDHAQEEEYTQSFGSDVLDSTEQINKSKVPIGSQSITDLTLNELAYELANELIQSVLDDFPFSEYLATIHAEASPKHLGQEAVMDGKQNILSHRAPWIPDSPDVDTSANNDADFSAAGDEANTYENDNIADLSDKHSRTILESKTSQESSHDPHSASSASERQRLKDADPSFDILGNEMLTTVTERKMSSEFSGLEEDEDEDIIESFPGRKFSKSEDYPSRRFSRDENSSRFDDSELEVNIGPEDIETGYLPNVDPFQGNLDIFETSFSKITDADREVAEEESFRRASGGGIAIDEEETEDRLSYDEEESSQKVDIACEEEQQEDIISGNEEESSQKVDDGESNSVGVDDGYVDVIHNDDFPEVSKSIPELREELVYSEEDISAELDSQVAGDHADDEDISENFNSQVAGDRTDDEDISREFYSQVAGDRAEDEDISREFYSQVAGDRTEDEDISREFYSQVPGDRTEDEDISKEFYSQVAGDRTEDEDISREFYSQVAGDRTEDEDISREFYSQVAGDQTEEEAFADFSREFPVLATETLDLKQAVDITTRLEDEAVEDFDKLDEDVISQSEREAVNMSNEMTLPALGKHDATWDNDFAEARRSIPEVREELVSDEEDISKEFNSQFVGDQTEGEAFADFSREFPVLTTQNSDLEKAVDFANHFEDKAIRDFDESDAEETDVISQREREEIDVSSEMTVQALGKHDATLDDDVVEASRSIPEVREELVYSEEDISGELDSHATADRVEDEEISREFDSQIDGDPTEGEAFADFSREFALLATEISGLEEAVDNQLEDEAVDLDKLDTEESDIISVSEREAVDVSYEMKIQAVGKHDAARDDDFVQTSRSIPEVREELVSDEEDISGEFDSQFVGDQTEGETFADFSNEFPVLATENSDLEQAVDIANQLEDEAVEDFDGLDTEETNIICQSEREALDVSSEIEVQALGKHDATQDGDLVEARRSIPEVREQLVSDEEDVSGEFDSQFAGDQTEGEAFAESSKEFPVLATEMSGLKEAVDIADQLEDEAVEDFDELDTEESDIISQSERDSIDVSSEIKMQALGKHDVIQDDDLVEASRSIPEVREQLVSDEEDISGEFDSQFVGDQTEGETFTDFSREFPVLTTDSSVLEEAVDFANKLEDETTEDIDELDAENTDVIRQGERYSVDVSNEMTVQTLGKHDAPQLDDVVEARRFIPEVREEFVSDEEDISEEFDLQAAGDQSEVETFTAFSREFPVLNSEISDLKEAVDIADHLEDKAAEDFDELDTEESDIISQSERETIDVSSEIKMQALGKHDVTQDDDLVEARRSVPEVREELVSDEVDVSEEFDSQFVGDQTEVEASADFSREFPVQATEILGLKEAVDIADQLEDEAVEDFDELDTEESDIISQNEREAVGVSSEIKMQEFEKHEVGYFKTGEAEVEDAEASSELDEQTTEKELDIQTEISQLSEVQTVATLSELEQTADTRHKFGADISKTARELEVQASVDDNITTDEASVLEVVQVPKQKKKIRVSFSEDFDDEIGDFNISSSSRSSLKSPPPLPSSGDSESPSPSPSPEDVNADSANEEDGILPLSATSSTNWALQEQTQRKEVYHTSAGRMSISVGEEEDGSSMALNNEISPSVASFTDEIIMKARAQVGEMIVSAKGTISEADDQLADTSLDASDAAVLYSSDISQPELSSDVSRPDFSSGTLHSAHDTAIMSEDEANNAFSTVSSDFATFDSTNPDSSAVNSNPLNEVRVKSLADSRNLELTETSAVISEPLTFNEPEPVPAVLAVSSYEDAPFDSLTSLPTHVRTLSGASTGSFQGAVYSEEWQDDEILQVAEQSGLEAEHDDPTRKKIVPASDFVEGAVADNDAEEVEDQEVKKEDDEESDAGDLEWENDTPVKIPSRPGIQPTLTEEEPSAEGQRWKRVSVSGSDFDIDLQVVEPFKNVLSHGGYYDEGLSAIIVFYGCNLPSRSRENYAYIMDHLFHYVIHTLEELVADDYVIIYFHGSTPRRQMPSLAWLKRCYQSIDRRLKKNLKGLFLVHPTLWLRTIVMMTKPFISGKFSSKLRFVRTLEELNALVPLTNVTIPDAIVHYDIHHQHLPSPPPSPSHAPDSD